ncbi:pentapeptide repeat-containing protein [Crocosphaera sp. Alani8]|uniref:pentapeptide repeat-containing protein n=1 Tax=Crocosphaera sp. Alani8 TaxID=3038952 RepID=UPI00313D16E7
MANKQHLNLLMQGVDTWNQWRKNNPEIIPDLRKANLSQLNLRGANLDYADLKQSKL